MTMKNVMDTWTLQQGYPFIHVNFAEGSWNIYQQKFTLNSETNKEPNFINCKKLLNYGGRQYYQYHEFNFSI